MEEKKALTAEQEEVVTGGLDRHEDARMARVFSVDGGPVNLYSDSYEGNPPFWQVPNGSEMKVDPSLHPEQYLFGRRCDPHYMVCYDYRWLMAKEGEVRFEWK